MNPRAVLLRYHEVALKGANRGWFEERLAINAKRLLERALGHENVISTERKRGRVIIYTPWNEQARKAIGRTFGITSFSPMKLVPTQKGSLIAAALEEFRDFVEKNGLPESFRVLTRRSDKALDETSPEIDRYIGAAILAAHPLLKVDLKKPKFILGIEIRNENSYLWTEKLRGLGGLPVGTNGRLLTLISGGLDSPIASIQMLKRGAILSFLHFYGIPFVGEEVLTKIKDLVRIINHYQPQPQPLIVVPFGKIQEKIALSSNPKFRTILYRRMMLRIASEVARREQAQALVTGESLGQVASQTLENLVTIDESATLPILRPLISYDKDEIIELAHHWETFEISIRPGIDCCTLFADRHPATRTNLPLILEQESKIPIEELTQEALTGIEFHSSA